MTVRVSVVDHPLVAARVTELRAVTTPPDRFRTLAGQVAALLLPTATAGLATRPVGVVTPVAETAGVALDAPPLLLPVLRAGLGLLDVALTALPESPVGFAGLARDEATLSAHWYLDRVPGELAGRPVLVLDPMLATGGTLVEVLQMLAGRGARQITVIALIAAPEGVRAVETACAASDLHVHLVVGALDERLDHRGFIVPGLGDAGDRLFGT